MDNPFCYTATLNPCMLGTLTYLILVLDFTMELVLGVKIVLNDG